MRISLAGVGISVWVMALLGSLFPVLSYWPATACLANAANHSQQDDRVQTNRDYFVNTACLNCHAKGGADTSIEKYRSDAFIQIEVKETWLQNDLHSRLFDILKSSERAARMYQLLGYTDDAAKAQNCYTCHALDKRPARMTQKVEDRFNLNSPGLACANCHGKGKAWQDEHYAEDNSKEPKWRSMSLAEKHRLGFTDLRSASAKAVLCASCHIGNASEGKIVTHEMYAAGHPPLPPFEMVTFMNSQPAHWKHPSELPYLRDRAAKDPQAAWNLFHYRAEDQELHQAREFAVGVIASFKMSMNLLADQATHRTNGLMDFAHFDCYACHHDLRVPSDRQKRGYPGAPGRPPLKAWLGVLPRIVVDHAAQMPGGEKLLQSKAVFKVRFQALQDAIQSQPFGDTASFNRAAQSLEEWAQWFINELELVRYSKEETKRLLNELIRNGNSRELVTDPESAWQIAWATNVLSAELKRVTGDRLEPHRIDLEKIVPLQIRSKPYQVNNRPASLYENDRFAQRQKLLSEFQLDSFLKLFKELETRK